MQIGIGIGCWFHEAAIAQGKAARENIASQIAKAKELGKRK